MIRLRLGSEPSRLEGTVEELETLLRERFEQLAARVPAPDLLGVLRFLERETPEGAAVEAVTIPAELLLAYERTNYEVQLPASRVVLRPGVWSEELTTLLGDGRFALLTASNPFSQRVAGTLDGLRLRELCAALPPGVAWLPARNLADDPTWPEEPGFYVAGLGREQACALGRRFGQNAILAREPGLPPVVVPCFPGA